MDQPVPLLDKCSTDDPPDSPVDEDILAELLMVMDSASRSGLTSICDLFLTGAPDRLADIAAALVEGRLDDAASHSHSLKGTGGAFGARRLSEVAGELEQACRRKDVQSTAGLLAKAQAEFLVFRDILEIRLVGPSATF